jgi:hypothetical protein
MRWVGHVAWKVVEENAYRFMMGQLESKGMLWKVWE